MTNYNNANLQALHNSLTSVHPEQDRSNFAPKLAGDIRVLLTDNSFLTLNTVDSDGLVWIVSDIEGWWNLSELEIPDIQRGFGDGSFDVSGRRLARTLTLNGSILIQSNDRATIAARSQSARAQLLSAFDLIKRGTWLIVDEDEYKRASFVRLSGLPNISTVNSKGRIDFSIGLKASDPIKYEWVEQSSDDPLVINDRLNYISITNRTSDSEYRYYSQGSGDNGLGDTSGFSSDTSGSVDYIREPVTDTPDGYRTYGDNYSTETTGLVSYDGSYYQSTFYLGNTSSGGDRAVSSNSVSVVNHGDTDVYCLFRVIGPLYGPAIISNTTTGQDMNILQGTAANSYQVLGPSDTNSTVEYLQIDTKTRQVNVGEVVGGQAYTSTTSSRGLLEPFVDWIYLQPGENTIYFNDGGTASGAVASTLQIYWRSGWIG